MSHPLITADELRDALSYDPETGVFTWVKTTRRGWVGARAGTVNHYGYICIRFRRRLYLAHRLAWLHVHGEWPPDDIDHINGDHADNRIANLRLATQSQNMANGRKPNSNTSGFKGVSWDARGEKWRADIMVNKKNHWLGYHATPEAAHAAYVAAAEHFFGDYARTA